MLTPELESQLSLLNHVLTLSTDPNAPIKDMTPLEMIAEGVKIAIESKQDNDFNLLFGGLVGTLSWIANHHAKEVFTAVRHVNNDALH